MILANIVITYFHEKLQKMSFIFFNKIWMIKDVQKKPREWPNIRVVSFKISNPDSVGVERNMLILKIQVARFEPTFLLNLQSKTHTWSAYTVRCFIFCLFGEYGK